MHIRVSVEMGMGKRGEAIAMLEKSSAACGHVSEVFQKGGGGSCSSNVDKCMVMRA